MTRPDLNHMKPVLKSFIRQQLVIAEPKDQRYLAEFLIECINETVDELQPKDHLQAALTQAEKAEDFEQARAIKQLMAKRNQ